MRVFRPRDQFLKITQRMEVFEATASRARTGTGSRREGGLFEKLVAEFWAKLVDELVNCGAKYQCVEGPSGRSWAKLSHKGRALYLPENIPAGDVELAPKGWLDLDFYVKDLVSSFPGQDDAIASYAPSVGQFAGQSYPLMYSGMRTRFDDTIVLERDGVLHEKIILEYKTGKSSASRQIDGNAHERLSFQIMQYLEVATRYTRCSLVVIANGAFIQYRNKYHVNFHVQADRLANFSWFRMEHLCYGKEYLILARGLANWLRQGVDRARLDSSP